MRKKITTFYTNEIDEEGRPEKHIRVADDFLRYIDEAVEEGILKEFKNSGLPEESLDRQKLFIFLANMKSAWTITMRTSLGLLVTGAVGWVIYKTTH